MTDQTPDLHDHRPSGPTRRTVMKGAAWAAPVIAVAAVVPETSASVPCLGGFGATGGSYPVNVGIAGCQVAGTHWDFQFKITATTTATCNCSHVQITLFDTPNRSQLWLDTNNNTPQRYVRKVLAIGQTDTFPKQGDVVYNVSNNSSVGTIEAPGDTQDSLHCLIQQSGAIGGPNLSGTGGCENYSAQAMASYQVLCGTSANGPWTNFPGGVGTGTINICVPVLQATVCAYGNGGRRIRISAPNLCGVPITNFKITNVQLNSDLNYPNQGSSIWSTGQFLTGNASSDVINFPSGFGNGSQLWISYTPDGGENIVRIRIPSASSGNC